MLCVLQLWPVWATRRRACCSMQQHWPVKSPQSRTWTTMRDSRLQPNTIRWVCGNVITEHQVQHGAPVFLYRINIHPVGSTVNIQFILWLSAVAVLCNLSVCLSVCLSSWPAERSATSRTRCCRPWTGSPPWTSLLRLWAPWASSCWPRPRRSSSSKPPQVHTEWTPKQSTHTHTV